MSEAYFKIRVRSDHGTRELSGKRGETLRSILLANDCTPYRGFFERWNCGGLNVCGSCWVTIEENGEIWKRRSCQIRVYQDLEIQVQ